MNSNPIAFKGVYKVTLPNVKEAKNETEKAAYTEAAINTVVMGANNSIERARVSGDNKSVYFKIDDKNDSNFETGFSNILNECNKKFNIEMAKKAYIQRVSNEEFNKAKVLD